MASPPLRCAHRPVRFSSPFEKGDWVMVMRGIDAHKRTHTVVAVDDLGRQAGVRTTLAMASWWQRFWVTAIRALKRRLSDVVFRALTDDATTSTATCPAQAA